MKICIVSSIGGHLDEVRQLLPIISRFEHFYVMNCKCELWPDMRERTFFVPGAARDLRNVRQMLSFWHVLRAQRPDLVISTGAGLIVNAALVCKLLRVPVIYIESFTAIRQPTLAGRIMYYLADRYLYQWEYLKEKLPRATYAGSIYDFRYDR